MNATLAVPEVDEKLAARIAALKTLQPGDILVLNHPGGCVSVMSVRSVDRYAANVSASVLLGSNRALHSMAATAAYAFDYLAANGPRVLRATEGAL